jgi:hypothetical protein
MSLQGSRLGHPVSDRIRISLMTKTSEMVSNRIRIILLTKRLDPVSDSDPDRLALDTDPTYI